MAVQAYHAAMKIVMNDDRVFQGTPLQIVRAMQDISFGAGIRPWSARKR